MKACILYNKSTCVHDGYEPCEFYSVIDGVGCMIGTVGGAKWTPENGYEVDSRPE